MYIEDIRLIQPTDTATIRCSDQLAMSAVRSSRALPNAPIFLLTLRLLLWNAFFVYIPEVVGEMIPTSA